MEYRETKKEFKKQMKIRNSNINRMGEIKEMTDGEMAKIVEYNKYNDIVVQIISTGEMIKSKYDIFFYR